MMEAGGGAHDPNAERETQTTVAGGWRHRADGTGGRWRGAGEGVVSDADGLIGGDGEPEHYPDWRLAFWRLTQNTTFQRSITALIVMNTLVLALDHHPLDDDFSTVLEACNFTFTLCFALEMVLKVCFYFVSDICVTYV